jgi:uncharacterized protein (TIGR02246 family)
MLTVNVVEKTEGTREDERAIEALYRDLLDSWGRGDGKAYAMQFTDDADYIAIDGSRQTGQSEIASRHQHRFDTWLKDTSLQGQIHRIRFLTPEAALVIATGGVVFPGKTEVRSNRRSIHSLVAVKHNGTWRFASLHNTRIQRRNFLKTLLSGLSGRVLRR